MRTTFTAMFAAAVLAWAPACKKDETAPAEAPAEETVEEEPTEPIEPAEPAEATPDMANKMAHCPSAVEGATTEVSEGEGAVVVTVTAEDEAAVTEIRERANHLAGLEPTDSAEVKHTGEGTGGGELGKCPVVMTDVEVSAEDVDGGSAVTVTPKDEAQLASLLAEAQKRAASLREGGHVHGTGMGGGKGGGEAKGKGEADDGM